MIPNLICWWRGCNIVRLSRQYFSVDESIATDQCSRCQAKGYIKYLGNKIVDTSINYKVKYE